MADRWEDLGAEYFDAAVAFFSPFTEDPEDNLPKWVKMRIKPTQAFADGEEEMAELDFDTAWDSYQAFFSFVEGLPFEEEDLKSFLAYFPVDDGAEDWEELADFLSERLGWSVHDLSEEERAAYGSEALESDEAFEAWYDALCDSCNEEEEEE